MNTADLKKEAEAIITDRERANLQADKMMETVWSMLHDAASVLDGAARMWEFMAKTPAAIAKAREARDIAGTIMAGRFPASAKQLDTPTQVAIANEITMSSARNHLLALKQKIEAEHIELVARQGLASHANPYDLLK